MELAELERVARGSLRTENNHRPKRSREMVMLMEARLEGDLLDSKYVI
jgi:hypothetical protein